MYTIHDITDIYANKKHCALEFMIGGGTEDCDYNYILCRHWRQSWHHDDSNISMQVGPYSKICPNRFGFWCFRYHYNDVIMNDGVSNHQPHHCLLNRLFGRRSKKTLMLRVAGLCAGNSPVTGEFPAQMVSYAETVSIWWRHHDQAPYLPICLRVPSLALGQLCGYPSSSETPQKNMGKWIHEPNGNREYNHNKTKHNKPYARFMGHSVYFPHINQDRKSPLLGRHARLYGQFDRRRKSWRQSRIPFYSSGLTDWCHTKMAVWWQTICNADGERCLVVKNRVII